MGLIRHSEAGEIARDAIVLDLGDLQRQAALMRERAEAEVADMLANGRAERARILEGAEAAGYEAGFAEGKNAGAAKGREEGRAASLAEMKEEIDRVTAAWERALGEFEGAREGMLAEAREGVLGLVAELAGRVVRKVLEGDGEAAVRRLEGALELTFHPTRVRVAVSADDGELVREALPGVMAKLGMSAHGEVEEDSGLGRGDVVVRTDHGEVDGRIEDELDRLADAIVDGGGG